MGAIADSDPEALPRPEFEGPSESLPTSDDGPVARSTRVVATVLPIAAAFALAFLVRCLSVGLPIEGDTVAYGALGRSLADGDGYAIDGTAHDRYPPGQPALLALALAFGGTVTSTTRWLGVWLGGIAAALLVSIGIRVGRGKAPVALLVVLAAAHPALALFAGGLVPGSEGLGLVLLLGAMRLALVRSRRAYLGAMALTSLLPLVRYDLVAFPIVLAWLVHRHLSGRAAGGKTIGEQIRARAPAFAMLFLPLALWVLRTWIVSGRPFGAGYASHGLSIARVPGNALVLLALVLPAAGLGVLWIFVPKGVQALWDARASDRPIVRTAMIGAAIHLALVALFAGPTYDGDGSLAFSSGSLRFGLAATPFLVLAAVMGLGSKPTAIRRPIVLAVTGLSVSLSVWLLGGGVQRAMPFPVNEAGRLHLIREAFDVAVAESAPSDWIALDLSPRWPDGPPRTNAGLEVFFGDRAPSRRTGVVVAGKVPAGVFPKAPVLPLIDGLGGTVKGWLVSDRAYQGMIYTGGGQGIFHRIGYREVRGGRAGSYTIHQVIRPPN